MCVCVCVRSRARYLVKGDGHDAVCGVEGILHAVAVVDINVDVQHAAVVLEHLEDGQHDVVDVAEARGLLLARVVQPARPADGNIARAVAQFGRTASSTHTVASAMQHTAHGARHAVHERGAAYPSREPPV